MDLVCRFEIYFPPHKILIKKLNERKINDFNNHFKMELISFMLKDKTIATSFKSVTIPTKKSLYGFYLTPEEEFLIIKSCINDNEMMTNLLDVIRNQLYEDDNNSRPFTVNICIEKSMRQIKIPDDTIKQAIYL